MSQLTHNILGAIEYDKVIEIRNENYDFLAKELSTQNTLVLYKPEGAFAYPLYMKNGNKIRKALAKYKIFIPKLWPNVIALITNKSIEYDYVENILPLPCDQRYGVSDMSTMVKFLREVC